jgi:hypothetical protein
VIVKWRQWARGHTPQGRHVSQHRQPRRRRQHPDPEGRRGWRGSWMSGRQGCHSCCRLWPLYVFVRRPSPFVTESQQTFSFSYIGSACRSRSLEIVVGVCLQHVCVWYRKLLVCSALNFVKSSTASLSSGPKRSGTFASIRSFDLALFQHKECL